MDEASKERIETLARNAAEQHDKWALEPDAASDYETLDNGLRLWKPTLPHVWALARASQMLKEDPYGMNLVVAWLLGHEQQDVRNSLMPMMRTRPAEELVAVAEEWLMDHGAGPEEVLPVVARLTQDALGAKKKRKEPEAD